MVLRAVIEQKELAIDNPLGKKLAIPRGHVSDNISGNMRFETQQLSHLWPQAVSKHDKW